jgi:hypothetical protein
MNEIFAQALKPFAPKVAIMEFCQECCSPQECESRGGCVGPAAFNRELTALRAACTALSEQAPIDSEWGTCGCCNKKGAHEPDCAVVLARAARRLAEDDMLRFGTGFVQRHADGLVEHLPLDQVVIHGGTTSVKNPS